MSSQHYVRSVSAANAFLHTCDACASMFLLAPTGVSIPMERRHGTQSREPVKRTISLDVTCALKTSICLAHLVPSLVLFCPLCPFSYLMLLTFSMPVPYFRLSLLHFHLFISHPRRRIPLCLCGFLYCICRISRLPSPSPSFFSSPLCRMFV